MQGDQIERVIETPLLPVTQLETPLLPNASTPENRRLSGASASVESSDERTGLMSTDDLMRAAVAHITDAVSYRDFADYGQYKLGVNAEQADQLRAKLRLHHLYYESAAVKTMRALAKIVFQLLVIFEQPPWCTSTRGGFHNGCGGLAQFHMSQIPKIPEVTSPISIHGVRFPY